MSELLIMRKRIDLAASPVLYDRPFSARGLEEDWQMPPHRLTPSGWPWSYFTLWRAWGSNYRLKPTDLPVEKLQAGLLQQYAFPE